MAPNAIAMDITEYPQRLSQSKKAECVRAVPGADPNPHRVLPSNGWIFFSPSLVIPDKLHTLGITLEL